MSYFFHFLQFSHFAGFCSRYRWFTVYAETKNIGPFPECLLNVAVEDVKYGDGIIIGVDSRKFELEVRFDAEVDNKTFIFPDCFLRKRLSVKDEAIQIGLTKHLQNYK